MKIRHPRTKPIVGDILYFPESSDTYNIYYLCHHSSITTTIYYGPRDTIFHSKLFNKDIREFSKSFIKKYHRWVKDTLGDKWSDREFNVYVQLEQAFLMIQFEVEYTNGAKYRITIDHDYNIKHKVGYVSEGIIFHHGLLDEEDWPRCSNIDQFLHHINRSFFTDPRPNKKLYGIFFKQAWED